ncbi:uncharacterized protein LOC18435042 isoform X1 [Amborella trichopoda]|uniref:uncharacterized protein LOC18435042 isoform X1 n=1 Tax=Amborella trichopoda TaxID=13333 RepID=UPI0009C19858|nr:uncharacterized protein LOC18435042 isoform X1 [Amborella trichopoda]|eukprot:XP_020523438.1 uncharacterized protein LOC18435042 isoform X1 [Amborella trichopoda]
METLKRHLPAGDPDGLSVLTKIAARFEEKIFTNAENQADYLGKISLKMLTLETESSMGNSTASNPTGEKPTYARLRMDKGGWMPPQGEGDVVLRDANDWRTELSADLRQRIVNKITDNDWRTKLSADSRQRIVNKILETLKRHFPAGDPIGLSVLTTIAAIFEEKIFTNAENQADYLGKISLKMLTLETESAMGNSTSSNPTGEKPKYTRSRLDTLKRHFPAGDPVGISVLTTVAEIFEEKIFTSAENQVLLSLLVNL